jgi:uncharacterized protein YegP (UPF0339 family)
MSGRLKSLMVLSATVLLAGWCNEATNGQIIGSSQMYASERTRDNGIASVMRHAPEAKIVELLD